MSKRDNFLEIVRQWCDYARVCLLLKHEVMTLTEFRAKECEWDSPDGRSVTPGWSKADEAKWVVDDKPPSDPLDYEGAIRRLRESTKGLAAEPKNEDVGVTIKSVTVEKIKPVIGPLPFDIDLLWHVVVRFGDGDVKMDARSGSAKQAAGNVVMQALYDKGLVKVIES